MLRPMLATLVTARALRGVEVGVNAGVYSREILKDLSGVRLLLVEVDSNKAPIITELLRGERYVLSAQSSEATAADVQDGIMDFVYIDADHEERSVAEDIRLWWPKVRSGGIFGGHDYDNDGAKGVRLAVDSFISRIGLELRTGDMDWWVVKP